MHPLAALLCWEGAWWARRRARRASLHSQALRRARALGRPLVVVGAPDRGMTSGYPPGDITIDIGPSRCPNFLQADITRRLPIQSDSCVVFVACVLEYVDDVQAAWKELLRISGGQLFVARVEPWTLTALLYPGAKRTVPEIAP